MFANSNLDPLRGAKWFKHHLGGCWKMLHNQVDGSAILGPKIPVHSWRSMDPSLLNHRLVGHPWCWHTYGQRGGVTSLDLKHDLNLSLFEYTPWSKYMAQSPKGNLIQGLYKPIHGNCAIYFYPGVTNIVWHHARLLAWSLQTNGVTNGFKYFLNFHSYLGKMIQSDEHIFSDGLKPQTSCNILRSVWIYHFWNLFVLYFGVWALLFLKKKAEPPIKTGVFGFQVCKRKADLQNVSPSNFEGRLRILPRCPDDVVVSNLGMLLYRTLEALSRQADGANEFTNMTQGGASDRFLLAQNLAHRLRLVYIYICCFCASQYSPGFF